MDGSSSCSDNQDGASDLGDAAFVIPDDTHIYERLPLKLVMIRAAAHQESSLNVARKASRSSAQPTEIDIMSQNGKSTASPDNSNRSDVRMPRKAAPQRTSVTTGSRIRSTARIGRRMTFQRIHSVPWTTSPATLRCS